MYVPVQKNVAVKKYLYGILTAFLLALKRC